MRLFLDTSALVKNYIEEAGSDNVANLMHESEVINVSSLTLIECFSTLRRVQHEKLITKKQYETLKKEISQDFDYFETVSSASALQYCERLIDKYQLKTLDSIQLGSCLCARQNIDAFEQLLPVLFDAIFWCFAISRVIFNSEMLSTSSKAFLAFSIGQDTKVADSHESLGHDMQEKAAEKIDSIQS